MTAEQFSSLIDSKIPQTLQRKIPGNCNATTYFIYFVKICLDINVHVSCKKA